MQSATIGDMKAEMLLDFMEEVESEKEYDRNTAATTLKMAIKMGYEIKKKR